MVRLVLTVNHRASRCSQAGTLQSVEQLAPCSGITVGVAEHEVSIRPKQASGLAKDRCQQSGVAAFSNQLAGRAVHDRVAGRLRRDEPCPSLKGQRQLSVLNVVVVRGIGQNQVHRAAG